jgi:AcrR family transcriptional regulator
MSKTYNKIYDVAKGLFMKHGIRRVSVEEICREAAVSKMTFYRYFANKEDVAEKIFFEVMEKGMEIYRDIMKQDIPYAEKVVKTIKLKRNSAHGLSEEFLKDIIQSEDSSLKQHLHEYRIKAQAEYLKDMKSEQKKGFIRKDIKPEFILYMMDDLYLKMSDERLLSLFKSQEDAGIALTKYFFYGIMSNSNS